MPQSDDAQRTEPATPKRKEDARRRGQVAQSRELGSLATLVAALVLFASGLLVHLGRELVTVAGASWSSPTTLASVGDFHAWLLFAGGRIAIPLASILVLLALAGGAASFAQVGPLFSFEVLQPKAERLSLIQGTKRLFDVDRLFDLVKSLFKVGIVGAIAGTVLLRAMDRVIGLSAVSLEAGLLEALWLARDVAIGILVFLGIMALVDVVYQRWRFEQRLRMSKKEIRDELKDREGDPLQRSRARALQREMTRSRMIAAVADADVVVTNPTRIAVALQYERGGSAPRVVAKGRNHTAARIREVARLHRVPIVENKPLARMLHRSVRAGDEIPESLFQAVAEVLAYVYRLDPSRAAAWRSPA